MLTIYIIAAAMTFIQVQAATVLLPVQTIVQKTDFCGEASVAMILSYYGKPVSQDDVHTRIFKLPAGGRGAYSTEIVSMLKNNGYSVTVENEYGYSTRTAMPADVSRRVISAIRKAIDNRQPVLFGWYPKTNVESQFFGHFSIAVGYDGDGIYIIDPRWDMMLYIKDSHLSGLLPLPTLDFSRWGYFWLTIGRSGL